MNINENIDSNNFLVNNNFEKVIENNIERNSC